MAPSRSAVRISLTAALVLLALAPVATAEAASKKSGRPNVVVIMADDQDFRSLGTMPKLRRLIASRGTTFATSISSYPLCCPSRATYYTGRYAHNHGVKWNNFPEGGYYKFNGRHTLPVWLRRSGYRTIHIGKYLNEYGERNPTEVPPGWSDWHGGVDPFTYRYYGFKLNHNGRVKTYGTRASDYQVDVEARLAERAIVKASRSRRPFFLNLAPIAPHTDSVTARREGTPAIPAPRHARRYANARLPRYPNFNEADITDKPAFLQGAFAQLLPPADIESLEQHYRGRMGSLLSVDDMVERVVKTLKRTGEYRDTVIVYTSDNGWILGEHRLRDPLTEDGRATGVKYLPYEGSSRVPLLIAGGPFPKKRTVNGVVVNADLTPTILKLTGAKATRSIDGRSLVAAARSPKLLAGRGVLLETFPNSRAPTYTSIRTQRYRYELHDGGDEGLYDLRTDPWELTSFHADPRYAPIKAILRSKLAALRTCGGRNCRINVGRLPAPG